MLHARKCAVCFPSLVGGNKGGLYWLEIEQLQVIVTKIG